MKNEGSDEQLLCGDVEVAETLFTFDKHNYRDCQNTYRGDNNQEYYLGDYSIEAGSVIDVRADRKSVGSCSIIRLRSKTRLSFRRNWNHIRMDGTDVVVLWFVKKGNLCISHPGGYSVAHAGDFAITKSMTPFSIECETDRDSLHEVLHVLVPAHVFRRFITSEISVGFSVVADGKLFAIAENILGHVLEDCGELSEETEQKLVDSALTVLADGIRGCDNLVPQRQTIADRRLQEVLRYVDVHLSDCKLSTATVAKACGISPRYMSLLLKQHGTSFKELVWDKRLKIASRWLSTTRPNDISIAEVAFKVGFKSPAHFSRMFKRVYHKGPREYRTGHLAGQQEIESKKNLFAGASSSAMQ